MKKAMSSSYDIAIIGLGPSGSILAQLLSKKHKVIAIDRKESIEKGFKKPCGGLLSSDATESISKVRYYTSKGCYSGSSNLCC